MNRILTAQDLGFTVKQTKAVIGQKLSDGKAFYLEQQIKTLYLHSYTDCEYLYKGRFDVGVWQPKGTKAKRDGNN